MARRQQQSLTHSQERPLGCVMSGATEALRVGLVQEVVPAGQQLDRAVAIACAVAAQALGYPAQPQEWPPAYPSRWNVTLVVPSG